MRNDVGGGRGSGRAIRARDPRLVGAPEPPPGDDPVEHDEPPFRGSLQRAAELERVGDGGVLRRGGSRRGIARRGTRRGLEAARDAVLGRGDAPVEVHQRRRERRRGGGAGQLSGERDPAREAHLQRLRGDADHLAGEARQGGGGGGGGGGGLGARGRAAQVARLARERGIGGRGPRPVDGLAGDRLRVAHGEPLERAVRERRGYVHAPAAPPGGVAAHVGAGDGEGDVGHSALFRDVGEEGFEEE